MYNFSQASSQHKYTVTSHLAYDNIHTVLSCPAWLGPYPLWLIQYALWSEISSALPLYDPITRIFSLFFPIILFFRGENGAEKENDGIVTGLCCGMFIVNKLCELNWIFSLSTVCGGRWKIGLCIKTLPILKFKNLPTQMTYQITIQNSLLVIQISSYNCYSISGESQILLS